MGKATAQSKILKEKGTQPNELEEEVNKALCDVEAAPGNELKAELREFKFSAAKEIECSSQKANTKNAIVIFVPYRNWREIAKTKTVIPKLIRELEKKFSGKHIVFLAQRTIFSKAHKRQFKGQLRPHSRTLTAVHASILEDLVYPTRIVGQRTRVRLDGSRLLKVLLDPNHTKDVEDKLNTFRAVYKKLTNKCVDFSFPASQ